MLILGLEILINEEENRTKRISKLLRAKSDN
jgi:hypothetical protein